METTLFEIKLIDGRIFRIFCANPSQKKRLQETIGKIQNYKPYVYEITNGIHNIKQWENITKNL